MVVEQGEPELPTLLFFYLYRLIHLLQINPTFQTAPRLIAIDEDKQIQTYGGWATIFMNCATENRKANLLELSACVKSFHKQFFFTEYYALK